MGIPGFGRGGRGRQFQRLVLRLFQDPQETQREPLGLLQRLNREHGKTIIMVTHDPKAAQFASRQVHLDKGVLTDAPVV